MTDFETSFYKVGKNTVLLKGIITKKDITKLRSWILRIKEKSSSKGVLIIDSEGGVSDTALLVDMLQVPIHTHIVRKAGSFAALIALMGSARTASSKAWLMLHGPRSTSIEQEGILYKHGYKLISTVSTVVPTPLKRYMTDALAGKEDVYFEIGFLKEEGALDCIHEYTGEDLKLYEDDSLWYNSKYIKEINVER